MAMSAGKEIEKHDMKDLQKTLIRKILKAEIKNIDFLFGILMS